MSPTAIKIRVKAMMTQTVSRLSANNAAYNWMSNANALLSFKGNSKNLELQMLNDSFKYRAHTAIADSADKVRKENIKRTLSMFA